MKKEAPSKGRSQRNSAFEEEFFHYLESFLEQLLVGKLKKKQKQQTNTLMDGISPNTLRQRSMSIAIEEDLKI